MIQDKILIIANEVDAKYGLSTDSANNLKTLITEKAIDISMKHKDTFNGKNVANFIFVSNNFVPIRIEPDDRRYCVLEVSPKFLDDYEYFYVLSESLRAPGFYENLMTFFLRLDIKNWRPETTLPYTEAKKRIIRECCGVSDKKIRQLTRDDLKKGVGRQELYEYYRDWSIEHNKKIHDQREFVKLIAESFEMICLHGQRLYRLKEQDSDQEPPSNPPPSPSIQQFQIAPPIPQFQLPPMPLVQPPPLPSSPKPFIQQQPSQEQKYEEEEDLPFFENYYDQQIQDDDDDDIFNLH